MIFQPLYASAQKGELLLVDNGFCHWHLRKNGQLTIREIISTRPGAGSKMLHRLENVLGAKFLFAKCPASLPANDWYAARGFIKQGEETTSGGTSLILWRKDLPIQHCPNVGDVEIILCANGNPRLAQIALDHGFHYGLQPTIKPVYRPYFFDQDWKNPQRDVYMQALALYHPYLATVLDLEQEDQYTDVLSWAEEATQYIEEVIIIPKVSGIIARLPKMLNGKQIRLGYSVRTRYGATTVPLEEFKGWPVHLLGGSPQRQMALYQRLHVVSADSNYVHKIAVDGKKFWSPASYAKYRYFPSLKESDGYEPHGAIYEAFRRSCVNVMQAWEDLILRGIFPALAEQKVYRRKRVKPY